MGVASVGSHGNDGGGTTTTTRSVKFPEPFAAAVSIGEVKDLLLSAKELSPYKAEDIEMYHIFPGNYQSPGDNKKALFDDEFVGRLVYEQGDSPFGPPWRKNGRPYQLTLGMRGRGTDSKDSS